MNFIIFVIYDLQKYYYGCFLLFKADLPIGEIARFVGYDDPNYFVKIFKRYEKETPSSFRNHNNAREVL